MLRTLSLFSFLSLFCLTACESHGPTPMPRGYSSYGEEFKSVKGQDARNVGYAYSIEKSTAVNDAIQTAASGLADQLDQKLSFNVDSIYLKEPAQTAFYNSFDNALRTALTNRGYMLDITKEQGAKEVEFLARHTALSCAVSPEKAAIDAVPMYLALAIETNANGVPADIVGGVYTVPLYDYKPAGNVKLDPKKIHGNVCP